MSLSYCASKNKGGVSILKQKLYNATLCVKKLKKNVY